MKDHLKYKRMDRIDKLSLLMKDYDISIFASFNQQHLALENIKI